MPPEAACGRLWIASSELRCTLPKYHIGMHWSKYRVDYEKIELSGEGELFWDGPDVEVPHDQAAE